MGTRLALDKIEISFILAKKGMKRVKHIKFSNNEFIGMEELSEENSITDGRIYVSENINILEHCRLQKSI